MKKGGPGAPRGAKMEAKWEQKLGSRSHGRVNKKKCEKVWNFGGKVWKSEVFGPEKHARKHGQGMKSWFFIFLDKKAIGKAPCPIRAGLKAEKGPEMNSAK